MRPRVAICQPAVILGGRLRVILGIVEALNDLGITPDIITAKLAFEADEINAMYGIAPAWQLRRVKSPRLAFSHGDLRYVSFNSLLSRYAPEYELLINTGNSLACLPSETRVMTYMFYPRKRRLEDPFDEIHRHRSTGRKFIGKLENVALRPLYGRVSTDDDHTVICMTRFTADAVNQAYGWVLDLPVIYPPVEVSSRIGGAHDKALAVATVGRFSVAKGQLEQIKLAERMPTVQFNIAGFANNNEYFRRCQAYVDSHQLDNVALYPDASSSELDTILSRSKYFLHTLVNEPFGITAVQAIAAGCLPIVHNSGGQRETVPLPELRYDSLDDVTELIYRFEEFEEMEVADIVRGLQQHAVANFDVSVFRESMRRVLCDKLHVEG